jgi:hypothetical protein
MWEAWKRNARRPSDIEEAASWDAAHDIFKAVHNPEAEVADAEALAYIRKSLPEWYDRLKELPEWNSETGQLRLYRGMRNESAAEARVHGRACIPAGKLVSMTFMRDSAVGFAGQGLNEGYVCSAEVPLSAIVFADLDRLYRHGNMDAEAEIVVLPITEIPVKCEIQSVSARVKMLSSRAQKMANESEKSRLADYELSLRNETDGSKSETLELQEREPI